MSVEFTLNNKKISVKAEHADMPLLWYLREECDLKGTKFGCGIGQCGACTIHFNGQAVRSCSIPVTAANGADITTIEGLSESTDSLHPVQQAWIDEDVAQCGYCQPGQIMATSALLMNTPSPTDEEITQNITNICRCGSYTRIRKAIRTAAKLAQHKSKTTAAKQSEVIFITQNVE